MWQRKKLKLEKNLIQFAYRKNATLLFKRFKVTVNILDVGQVGHCQNPLIIQNDSPLPTFTTSRLYLLAHRLHNIQVPKQ